LREDQIRCRRSGIVLGHHVLIAKGDVDVAVRIGGDAPRVRAAGDESRPAQREILAERSGEIFDVITGDNRFPDGSTPTANGKQSQCRQVDDLHALAADEDMHAIGVLPVRMRFVMREGRPSSFDQRNRTGDLMITNQVLAVDSGPNAKGVRRNVGECVRVREGRRTCDTDAARSGFPCAADKRVVESERSLALAMVTRFAEAQGLHQRVGAIVEEENHLRPTHRAGRDPVDPLESVVPSKRLHHGPRRPPR